MKYIQFQVKTAFQNFKRNKVRTFLTSLGIMIGVLSVVILIALGIGLKNFIQGEFDSLGSNLLFILPGRVLSEDGSFQGGGQNPIGVQFDERDVDSLKRNLTADYVVPLYTKTVLVDAEGITKSGDVFASNEDVFVILSLEADRGTVFSASDVGKRAKSVVIGSKLATDLYGSVDAAVGQKIRFSNQRFSIMGVLKEKGGGGFGGPNYDNGIFMPYTTAASGINPDKKFYALYVGVSDEALVPGVKAQIEEILLRRYKEDDFSVIQQTEILNAITSIFSIINSVLIAIGSVSLIVGGIGIMNIMYANVTERTKEIGIRRAIGATKRDILFQFLAESILLSLFGGFSGLVFAGIIVILVQPFFPLALNAFSAFIALGISTFIGVFFGVFPARRAASLTPIEAIRYE